jgi:putative membrane protein
MSFDLRESVIIFLKGLFMGSADIIPGVSGGTIALITGIYERLVHAISSINFTFMKPLLKGDFSGFKERLLYEIDFELFIPLLLGIAVAFLSLAKLISYLLVAQTANIFAFFLGLILASAYILYTKLDGLNFKLIVTTVIGIVLSYIFVGLNPIAANHSLIVIFFSGIIAICAMILPGISGSFLLLLLGQYQYMLNCLSNLKITEMIVFIVGAVIGILGFSKVLNYLLENHESITMAFLIGIMIGTLRLPVDKITTSISGSWIPCVVLAIIGFVLIIVMEKKFNYIED